MNTTKIFLAALIVSVTFIPDIAKCDIILTLSDGGASTVNWSLSGSSTLTGAVASNSSNSYRLPSSSSWNSFFSAGTFDDSGSELLNVSNVSPRTVQTSGSPAAFVDGSRVPLAGGGFATDGDWTANFGSEGTKAAFRFLSTGISNHQAPALTGDEVISATGSGTFDVGSGTFTTNFNVGTYSHVGTTGLKSQVIVVPEPSCFFLGLLALSCAGVFGSSRCRGLAMR